MGRDDGTRFRRGMPHKVDRAVVISIKARRMNMLARSKAYTVVHSDRNEPRLKIRLGNPPSQITTAIIIGLTEEVHLG